MRVHCVDTLRHYASNSCAYKQNQHRCNTHKENVKQDQMAVLSFFCSVFTTAMKASDLVIQISSRKKRQYQKDSSPIIVHEGSSDEPSLKCWCTSNRSETRSTRRSRKVCLRRLNTGCRGDRFMVLPSVAEFSYLSGSPWLIERTPQGRVVVWRHERKSKGFDWVPNPARFTASRPRIDSLRNILL